MTHPTTIDAPEIQARILLLEAQEFLDRLKEPDRFDKAAFWLKLNAAWEIIGRL